MTQPALRFLSLGIDLTKEEHDVLDKIYATLDRLTQRRKAHMSLSSNGLDGVLREVFLYRLVAAASGTIVNWNTGNVLCSFLAARALFETFAFLWDYDRAIAMAQTGTLEEFEAITRIRLGATRNPKWIKTNPEWKSTNILTLIDRLSEVRSAGLRNAYDEMSNRCHPNSEGLFYMFADLDEEAEIVRFSDRNKHVGWAFHLVFAVTGLIVEAEEILERLENATPKIAAELQLKSFQQKVSKAERNEKHFSKFIKDETKAFQGHADEQFNLGNAYAIGSAMIPKNLVLAHLWFSLAAAQGNEKAVKNRDMVAREMTSAQIVEAEALASEWKTMTSEQFAEMEKETEEEMEKYWREWQRESPAN
jgi:hypothetical protein